MKDMLKAAIIIGLLVSMVFVAGCAGGGRLQVLNSKNIPNVTVIKPLIPLDENNTWIKSGEPTKSVYFFNAKFEDGSYNMQSSPISDSRINKDAVDKNTANVTITTPEYRMECMGWENAPAYGCTWENRGGPITTYTFHLPKEAKS